MPVAQLRCSGLPGFGSGLDVDVVEVGRSCGSSPALVARGFGMLQQGVGGRSNDEDAAYGRHDKEG